MLNINTIRAEKTAQKTSSNSLINGMYKDTSYGLTENGAMTLTRSGSSLLDFYAMAGAMRNNEKDALDLFQKAFSEDRLLAVRILFYLRDIRGGQGERKLFRNCLQWLGETYPDIFEKIIGYVPEYGRWDDLFFDNQSVTDLIYNQLVKDKDNETPSLLAKWLPTINASSQSTRAKARFFVNKWKMKEIDYRKLIRSIRKKIKVVEEKMSARKWSEIDYSSVPSQASRIYKNAFKKHDEERYDKFIEKAEKGEVKINASTLYPYQIYKSCQKDYSKTLEALWKQLPDYTQGKNAIVVADVSGSMEGDPMAVSVSLALYFAERNKGQFKDYFITFSGSPKLQKVQGVNLMDKMNSIERADWGMNTDLQKVFDLILNTGLKNNTPQEEMPETIYIISDMEFDSACDCRTNFEVIKEKYDNSKYRMPNLVFWNVDTRQKNVPVEKNEQGVSLVSGFSPVIFKIAVENKTPEQVMLDTINYERYLKINI
jgi:hypothetical protein